jgi:hypothetical protein
MRFAYNQLNNAVRAPPMCRYPVGEGANRVTTGEGAGVADPAAALSDVALNRAVSQT